MSEKTYVEDIDRSVYDIKNEEKDAYQCQRRSDSSHRRTDFQEKNMTRSGCSCSVWNHLQIYNAVTGSRLGTFY